MWNSNQNQLPAGDPKKILKYALGIGAGLLVLWIFVLAQSDSRSNTYNEEDTARLEKLRDVLGREDVPIQQQQSQGLLSNALTTFFILGGTIFVLWFYFRQKSPPPPAANTLFKLVTRQSLPTGQEIQVIEINNEYWVLASTHQQVTLLHRYKKEEWDLIVDEVNEAEKPASFASLLSKFQKQ